MWPAKPIEYVKLPNDDVGEHFGLFLGDRLISIVSLFIKNGEAQFRKFATLEEFQDLGYGTLLLKKVMAIAQTYGVRSIWCNARVEKAGFYKKFGLSTTDKRFHKGGVEYVIMEKRLIIKNQ
ncbi:GNAT family N-acetyltransferase [marine bacterium AO1-C]|nr:GNAT family N-acetyltransferase [marine bacterium AO1-C]